MAESTSPRAAAMQDVKHVGREAAASPEMTLLARTGYAAKGIVYLIVGALAGKVALGEGGSTTDRNGALRAIYEQPFGKILLAIVAVGLVGYALWSFIQALVDPDHQGNTAKG